MIEVFDAGGRRVLARNVIRRGEGPEVLELDEAHSLGPGVYWMRLSQGAAATTKRFIVLR
jgi:hypothetical protein